MELPPTLPPEFPKGAPVPSRAGIGQPDRISLLVAKLLTSQLTDAEIVAAINEGLEKNNFSSLAVSDLGAFERAVQMVSDNHWKGVASYVRYLFPNTVEGTCSRAIETINAEKMHYQLTLLEFIYKLPKSVALDKRSELESFIKTVSTDTLAFIYHLDDASKTTLLEKLSQIPQGERSDVLKHALTVIQKGVDSGDICAIIETIGKIPQDQRDDVIKHALTIINKSGCYSNVSRTIWMISEIPPDQRRDVLEHVLPIIPKAVTSENIYEIIETIRQIPQGERNEVLKYALTILPFQMPVNRGNMAYYTRYGHESPTSPIIPEGVTSRDICAIIETIGKIPQGERSDVLKHALTVIQKGVDSGDICAIIETIGKITPDQRSDVVKHALTIINKSGCYSDVSHTIWIISKTPPDQRNAVLTAAIPLTDLPEYQPEQKMFAARRIFSLNSMDTRFTTLITQTNDVAFSRCLVNESNTIWGLTVSQRNQLITLLEQVPIPDRARVFPNILLRVNPSRVTVESNTIRLKIARDEISGYPLEVLHNLTSDFKSGVAPKLSITFLGEAGVDASGLSREFISLLNSAIKDKMKYRERKNGLYEPFSKEIEGSEIAYQDIGKLMMFCLNSQHTDRPCPTGMILDLSVFVALNALANTTISQDDFNKPEHFDELFAIYKMMKSINEDDKTMIRNSEEMLKADDATIKAFLSDEDIENPPDPKKALQQYIIDTCIKPQLAPLVEIVRGMQSVQFPGISWEEVKAMNPQTLSEQLQGVVTREQVVNQTIFIDIPDEKQKWIKNWIMTTSDDNVKQFLFAITGAPALGIKPLQIKKSTIVDVYWHTCFNSVDISIDSFLTEAELHTFLDREVKSVPGYLRA